MAAKSASPAALQILGEIGLGNVPENWDIIRIDDLLSDDRGISVGVMYPGDHDYSGIPLIRAGDLAGSRINPRPEFRISPEKHHDYRRTALEGGELLISLVGDVGRCAVVPPRMAGWNAARAIAVLRFADASDAAFARLCLISPPLQHLMRTWATTTVQATLNLKEIRQIPLPWPQKAERDAITQILGALDDKIELNRRMNETLEAMARALFKSWFVDFDPVRAKAEGRQPAGMDSATAALFPDRFEDSPLGEIPRGWRVMPLDETAEFLNGLAMQKYPPTSDDYLPVIKIAELRKGITEASGKADANLDPRFVIHDGDFLFSWSGSLEAQIWCGGRGALNQHLFKVTPRGFPMWFVFQWVREHLPWFQAIAAGKATTMGHIQRHHLTDALVVVPCDEVLGAADRVLAPMLDRVVANNVEARTLAATRDALLPKLLAGTVNFGIRAHADSGVV